ncbi:AcrR family transcriptional regulator [Streptomyces sp. SAI-144]|jgi:AcrR family transcriptional regulator|uniref:TetR/AcrR family transcriptional regulator n=1 Tax=unclassified Streptomyces TaxID=2593676 RepID=UPI00247315B1|nr:MULTISPECIES: TetR/AcrR family transcriptional regulator [unclassified Streptomyces]MDH6435237.1 AcrR family transcriptional regulator [Streptomyces sp. SAI-144]MDH6489312.1 AcrR family transcriptional regulator [Streptomyces sp. SAI-127]
MQKRSRSTREALVRAAVELVANGRLTDAGLVNICNTAGVSRGALYHHFSSIAELVTEVYTQAQGRVLALAEESLDSPGADAPARFGIALGKALAEDQLVRAGLRLAADGTDDPPRLREEVLDRLRVRILADAPDSPDRQVLADLAVVVTAGLESLGYADAVWWSPERGKRIWDRVLPLFEETGAGAEAGGAGRERRASSQPPWDTAPGLP